MKEFKVNILGYEEKFYINIKDNDTQDDVINKVWQELSAHSNDLPTDLNPRPIKVAYAGKKIGGKTLFNDIATTKDQLHVTLNLGCVSEKKVTFKTTQREEPVSTFKLSGPKADEQRNNFYIELIKIERKRLLNTFNSRKKIRLIDEALERLTPNIGTIDLTNDARLFKALTTHRIGFFGKTKTYDRINEAMQEYTDTINKLNG